ncbi:Trypsin-like serine proteases, typically periplasmic, contain C-terminal PDZ domain [Paenibacillus uliginis N3/975]|uniref:Trypsin-like serine proteases, typically periplasmic, contain C-terminal PDZ domain n=1 Tax=Paenibacillus uliginis N3/975 TaxID=1313296 RepID=A0A1X7GEK3_9BACL|nr:PDZ domain-containing protein [Paenibacillus uliginis]SMF68401.1 Trypsin-like serine proteases, typically periplasmic, contain C-terminal PDZ domain [Paenibacillus uliginis N3/975]
MITELVEPCRMVIADDENELTIWTLEPHAEGTLVGIEYTGLWPGDLGIMSMENMAYGTYRFMTNMKSVLESSQDIRSSFWKSWIGTKHISYESSETKGVKVVQVIEGTPADGVLQEGDIITHLNMTGVQSYDELEEKITSMEPLKVLKIKYLRGGVVEVAEQ